jgi:type VI secretion system FHA domain protein
MPYVINVLARTDAQAPATAERRVVAASRMTIGRGAECSVRLLDPSKHVSRVHAVIDLEGTKHVLTVLSRVNPLLVNGVKVAPAQTAPVKANDVIEIGDFTIQLIDLHQSAPTPNASAARQIPASPFDFGLGSTSDTVPSDDPFRALDDLVPAKPAARPAVPAADPFELPSAKAKGSDSSAMVEGLAGISAHDLGNANDSTDPLANLIGDRDAQIRDIDGATFNPQPPGIAALDDILGGSPGNLSGKPLVDLSMRHPGGSSNIDHVQSINVAFNAPGIRAEPSRPARSVPPATARPASPADPFDGLDPFGSLIKPRAEQVAAPGAVKRDEPRAPAAPRPASTPPARPAPVTGAARRELAAFFEAAGLGSLQITDRDAEAFMRESGAIVRAVVEGLISLLIARSEMKREMRAEDRTMVASRNNNPLKLMTDTREAMRFLFDARERVGGAFLPPVQAVQDACEDLRVHDIALMAGMRAAFQGALKRFAPQYIEREVDKQGGSFTLNKKVKLWDAFVAHHEKLSHDAEDDLLKVFGKEFLATYTAQVRRLRAER